MTEINKYQNGKIYKIVCNKTNLIYIGSTAEKYLSNRLKGHRRNYKLHLEGKKNIASSYKILENNDYYIELLELFPCGSKDELLVRERYYFELLECINKVKPQITEDEEKEYTKKYYEEHKEEIKEQKKQYQQDNKEKIKEQKKHYREEHKEQLKEKNQKYQDENKVKILEQKKQYYQNNKLKILEQKKQYHILKRELGVNKDEPLLNNI